MFSLCFNTIQLILIRLVGGAQGLIGGSAVASAVAGGGKDRNRLNGAATAPGAAAAGPAGYAGLSGLRAHPYARS